MKFFSTKNKDIHSYEHYLQRHGSYMVFKMLSILSTYGIFLPLFLVLLLAYQTLEISGQYVKKRIFHGIE